MVLVAPESDCLARGAQSSLSPKVTERAQGTRKPGPHSNSATYRLVIWHKFLCSSDLHFLYLENGTNLSYLQYMSEIRMSS